MTNPAIANHSALLITWDRAYPGREIEAMKAFGEIMSYLQESKRNSVIESFEQVVLVPHAGDLNGFVLIRGNEGQLAKLRSDEKCWVLLHKFNTCVDRMGFLGAVVGEGIPLLMQQIQKSIQAR